MAKEKAAGRGGSEKPTVQEWVPSSSRTPPKLGKILGPNEMIQAPEDFPESHKCSRRGSRVALTHQLSSIGGLFGGVAIGVHQQLGVAVQVNEGFEVAMLLDQVNH